MATGSFHIRTARGNPQASFDQSSTGKPSLDYIEKKTSNLTNNATTVQLINLWAVRVDYTCTQLTVRAHNADRSGTTKLTTAQRKAIRVGLMVMPIDDDGEGWNTGETAAANTAWINTVNDYNTLGLYQQSEDNLTVSPTKFTFDTTDTDELKFATDGVATATRVGFRLHSSDNANIAPDSDGGARTYSLEHLDRGIQFNPGIFGKHTRPIGVIMALRNATAMNDITTTLQVHALLGRSS